MGDLHARGVQSRRVYRVAMVLGGDIDAAGAEVLHGMVPAPVAERQLEGARAEGAAEDLVAEADPEDRLLADEFPRRLHDVAEPRGITRSRREGDPIRLRGEELLGRRRTRDHRGLA